MIRQPAPDDVVGRERRAVAECQAGAEVEDDLAPPSRNSHDAARAGRVWRLRVDRGQALEQLGRDGRAVDVALAGRIERFGAVARIRTVSLVAARTTPARRLAVATRGATSWIAATVDEEGTVGREAAIRRDGGRSGRRLRAGGSRSAARSDPPGPRRRQSTSP